MRIVVVLLVVLIASCTKPNPGVCCVTAEQCSSLGVSDLRPCDVGQACKDDRCVAAECVTSETCTSPDAPICQYGLCVGTCSSNDDCAGVADRPFCSPAGACVGCVDATQCAAPIAVCDPADHVCRGCEEDSECASGVCVDAGD